MIVPADNVPEALRDLADRFERNEERGDGWCIVVVPGGSGKFPCIYGFGPGANQDGAAWIELELAKDHLKWLYHHGLNRRESEHAVDP